LPSRAVACSPSPATAMSREVTQAVWAISRNELTVNDINFLSEMNTPEPPKSYSFPDFLSRDTSTASGMDVEMAVD
jgi:hypothetical protein